MDLRLLTIPTEKPEEFLSFCRKDLGLSSNSAFKLYYLSFFVVSLADTPIFKFLERLPANAKFDELKKNNYLLSMPVSTIRSLFLEHLDLKFTKNLYLYLQEVLPPEFFRGCEPKHAVISSQDIKVRLLTELEKKELSPPVKVKHLHFIFELTGTCEEIIKLLPNLSLYVLKRKQNLYQAFFSLSIAEFIVLSNILSGVKGLSEKVERVLQELKSLVPDCFG